ncbi:hypothetical protein, partial [Xanthomonas vesicatoria]|uniref:hypothetical protein n=1 Tax=Xanthomonas vesicatoria TaxID=56460 RepID=UPI001E562FCE
YPNLPALSCVRRSVDNRFLNSLSIPASASTQRGALPMRLQRDIATCATVTIDPHETGVRSCDRTRYCRHAVLDDAYSMHRNASFGAS